jgi:chromosome segregation ATPase
MEARIEVLLDEFEGLCETHAEYVDTVDFEDMEARELWEEIQAQLKQLRRMVTRVRRKGAASDEDLDEVEALMAELSDQYGELGALL